MTNVGLPGNFDISSSIMTPRSRIHPPFKSLYIYHYFCGEHNYRNFDDILTKLGMGTWGPKMKAKFVYEPNRTGGTGNRGI